jgi:hypothetical protein
MKTPRRVSAIPTYIIPFSISPQSVEDSEGGSQQPCPPAFRSVCRCHSLLNRLRPPKVRGHWADHLVAMLRHRRDACTRRDAGVRPSEIAIRLGIGRASVYRVLAGQHDGEHATA